LHHHRGDLHQRQEGLFLHVPGGRGDVDHHVVLEHPALDQQRFVFLTQRAGDAHQAPIGHVLDQEMRQQPALGLSIVAQGIEQRRHIAHAGIGARLLDDAGLHFVGQPDHLQRHPAGVANGAHREGQ
jgi:hypothetical protein